MNPDRIPEAAQRGWSEGYIAGEAERITLATANCDLRSDNRHLRAEIVRLRGLLAEWRVLGWEGE